MPKVLMFQPWKAPLVKSGECRQTIRPTRKRPIKVGEGLSLREWTGKPYRSKHRLLREARCTAVTPIEIGDYTLGSPCHLDGHLVGVMRRHKVAVEDGFTHYGAMLDWFEATHGLPFEGVLINWGEEVKGNA